MKCIKCKIKEAIPGENICLMCEEMYLEQLRDADYERQQQKMREEFEDENSA